jgi:16S rRNA (adenine1518-N6/adenine1519-N6)-dimethyltransferase
MQHIPRKRFGQHFLQEPAILDAMIAAIQPRVSDTMIEIGPGLGALTKPLLRYLSSLTAIEIDEDLQIFLQKEFSKEKLHILAKDALTVDYHSFGEKIRIVGNLPYNISTPLLLRLLSFTENIQDMHFLLQKEVVDRLVGQPGTKAYGRLSIIVQYFCKAIPLLAVPCEAFYPPPKVQSTFIRLVPHSPSPFAAVCIEGLQEVVKLAFSMRRKTLANTLKPLLHAEELHKLGIQPSLRPEQISIVEYIIITNYLFAGGHFVSSTREKGANPF